MGQKVNPIGLRLGINKTWKSKWYVDSKKYKETLHEDLKLRKAFLSTEEAKGAEISDIQIVRQGQKVTITVSSARPGVLIGQKGATIEKLSHDLQALTDSKVVIKINEIKRPECDATLIAENIARQLEARGAFRRALKNALSKAIQAGAEGIKVKVSGRLGGAEIARSEWMKEGRVPLHTLRADIDYGFAVAETTFGTIGVKVWVFNGEIFDKAKTDTEHVGIVTNKKSAAVEERE